MKHEVHKSNIQLLNRYKGAIVNYAIDCWIMDGRCNECIGHSIDELSNKLERCSSLEILAIRDSYLRKRRMI
jgi:hypothetical protein